MSSAASSKPSPSGRELGEGELAPISATKKNSPLPADLLARACQLRREITDAEKLLWSVLRNRQLFGMKFRRQHAIDGYVADFYCHEARLIVELDGGQHNRDANALKDAERGAFLKARGHTILRFWNNEVRENLEGVLTTIAEQAPPHPSSLPEGEGVETSMLDALPEAVLWLDAQGCIHRANAATEPLFLQSGAKLIGQSLSQWVQETDVLAKALGADAPGKEQTLTLLPRHRPPLPVWIEVWPARHGDGSRAPERVVRLRPVVAPAASTNPQESAAYMAAVLAHEIKNPLSGIRGAAQFLLPQLDDQAEPMARLIMTEVDRIRGLLEQMDVFTQPKPAAMEVLNIHESLRHASALLAAGASENFELVERFDPSLPLVSARKDALVQIVLNLMKNALEAMEGQPVSLLTLHTDYHRDGNGGTWVRLRVIDQGTGIPEALQPSIFEPFVTTKPQGKGLGLAIVAKLALDMGARLQLAGSGPDGTVFELLLPLAR